MSLVPHKARQHKKLLVILRELLQPLPEKLASIYDYRSLD